MKAATYYTGSKYENISAYTINFKLKIGLTRFSILLFWHRKFFQLEMK